MHTLTIDPSGRWLELDGSPHPLIVDTAWSAFADASEEEWRVYLAARRRQGFTAMLVSYLPIPHDRFERTEALEPYALDADRRPDFAQPSAAYDATARRFTEIAHDEFGIRLMVAVVWNNYVAGTWGAQATPWTVMPDTARRAYVERVARTLGELEPIFVVGGDDDYTVGSANAAYLEAIDLLRELAPSCLLTTHSTPNAVLPEAIADRLDFHLHQSGHNVENQELPWRQPAQYLARNPRKPLLASEPPYELHGKVGGHGRWSREDVRHANWASILGGSTAGIGYGAHGSWMWATTRGRFHAERPSLAPFTWVEALSLPGALDISLLARLFDDHGLHRLAPAQQLLADDRGGAIRAAASDDGALVAVHLPFAVEVELDVDLSGHRLTAWDLEARAPVTPDPVVADGRTRLRQLFSTSDQLVIAERR